MAKSKQLGLRLDDKDSMDLRRLAEFEGRSEQEILRDSLRLYVRRADEERAFVESVEKGWYEIHSGLGEVVGEDDQFFAAIRKEIRNVTTPD